MSLTTPYREQFLVADGITTTFPFDDHGDGFDAISKNYVKCEIYNADGSVIVPDFTVDLSAKTITITSLTTPDGQVLNAPQNGAIVRIYRDVPETQNTTAQALQASTAQQIVQNFDNIVAMIQEVQYANEHFTLRSTLPQRDLQIDLLRDIDDQKLVYWDNEKRKLVVTNYRQDELLLPADKEDILAQANAYSDEQNALLESRINGKLTAVDAQIDANADAIQKTREDYIRADSEIHQILNNHASELTTLRGNQASLGDQVSGIEEKIPGEASATNQLATKADLKSIDLDGYATETYVNTREQKIRDDVNAEDSRLQSQITAQASAITANTTSINGVKAVIPQGTSETNPLINKQQLLDEEMDIRDDLNEMASELQTQITAQAAEIAGKQDQLIAGDNITIVDNVISATGGGGGGGIANVIHDATLTGSGTNASPLGLAEAIKDEIADKAPKETVEALTQAVNLNIGEIGNVDNKLSQLESDLAESINTKELTVSTDEGTLNFSITAGVATIATNNGLDIASQTKFDTAPTTDDNTTWANASEVSLVRKAQVATAISDAVANIDALPDQSGNAGKVLTTDGSTASWQEPQGGGTKVIIKRYN